MKMTKSETDKTRKIWGDVYLFWKTYKELDRLADPDGYWAALVHDADLLGERHNQDELFCALMMACLDDLEGRKRK